MPASLFQNPFNVYQILAPLTVTRVPLLNNSIIARGSRYALLCEVIQAKKYCATSAY